MIKTVMHSLEHTLARTPMEAAVSLVLAFHGPVHVCSAHHGEALWFRHVFFFFLPFCKS